MTNEQLKDIRIKCGIVRYHKDFEQIQLETAKKAKLEVIEEIQGLAEIEVKWDYPAETLFNQGYGSGWIAMAKKVLSKLTELKNKLT